MDSNKTLGDIVRNIVKDDTRNCFVYRCDNESCDGTVLMTCINTRHIDKPATVKDDGNIYLMDGSRTPYIMRHWELTDDAKDEFVKGFADGMPKHYSYQLDCENITPWSMPWLNHAGDSYIWPGMLPYDMGMEWARHEVKAWVKAIKRELDDYLKEMDC